MAAGAGADRDDAVDAGLGRLLGVAARDHVVEDEAAVGMHGVDQVAHRAERGDDERHAVCDDRPRGRPRAAGWTGGRSG